MNRICLVIPSLQPGGMERVMSELAEFFYKKGEFEIHIVLYGKNPELFYPIREEVFIHKPSVNLNYRFRILLTFDRMVYLRKKIKSLNPVSVLSFGEYWNNLVLISLYGLRLPIYVSDRCQPDKSLGIFHDLVRRFLYQKAAGVIVQTMKAKEIYQRILPETKLKTIGNPIRPIPGGNDQKKENIVISVGMLIRSKHFDSLIRSFAEINLNGWNLLIVGDDANRQNNKAGLNALIKELHCEDRIILAGLSNDVDNLYKKSKIFAFMSSSEGFPNVVGEAMAAGLPVVAFDCVAGPSEMVTDGQDGYLVSLFDYEQFKKRLTLLMKDQFLAKEMGIKAIKNIKRYSPEKIGEQYYSLITGLQ